MEMTIAESIQTLEYLRDSGVFPFSTKEGVLYTTESIDDAIATMRKYQKVQEIMKSKKMNALNTGLLIPKDMACVLHEIQEVIEDENDGR